MATTTPKRSRKPTAPRAPEKMTDRQRWIATMHYQPRDRAPLYDFNFWEETLPIWQERDGLPRTIDRGNSHRYFGLDTSLGGGDATWTTGCDVWLVPGFEGKVIEDRGDSEIVQQNDGVRVHRQKFLGSIPTHEGHLLVDRASWREHYKPKLDPSDKRRYPEDWDARVKLWRDPNRDYPIFLPGGSLYGWIRNWMGVESASMAVYDDPAWFEEMVETVCDCVCGVLQRVLETGGRFEACSMWEDMCYSGGPLLSPAHFKQFLVPRYRRITDLLREHGVDVTFVDCDGKIDGLVPLWIEGGVNCMFPIEVGTWHADPVKFRQRYGKDLLLMGGVSKHLLMSGKARIDAEIKRLTPLVDEGGYIPTPDHRVPPDVPLSNYVYYCDRIREVWGRGINLPVRGVVPAQ